MRKSPCLVARVHRSRSFPRRQGGRACLRARLSGKPTSCSTCGRDPPPDHLRKAWSFDEPSAPKRRLRRRLHAGRELWRSQEQRPQRHRAPNRKGEAASKWSIARPDQEPEVFWWSPLMRASAPNASDVLGTPSFYVTSFNAPFRREDSALVAPFGRLPTVAGPCGPLRAH